MKKYLEEYNCFNQTAMDIACASGGECRRPFSGFGKGCRGIECFKGAAFPEQGGGRAKEDSDEGERRRGRSPGPSQREAGARCSGGASWRARCCEYEEINGAIVTPRRERADPVPPPVEHCVVLLQEYVAEYPERPVGGWHVQADESQAARCRPARAPRIRGEST